MAVLFLLDRFVTDSVLLLVRFVLLSFGAEEDEEAAKRDAVEVPLTVMSASIGIHFVLSAIASSHRLVEIHERRRFLE